VHSVVTRAVVGSNPTAPAIMKYQVNDVVLVESIAGPQVHVRLLKRVKKINEGYGADGWDAILLYEKEIEKLRKAGVPYPKKGEHKVWVFDEDIIKKKKNKKRKIR
jgi:hypothetical protein